MTADVLDVLIAGKLAGVRRFGENGVGRRRQGAQGAHGGADRAAVRKVAERAEELGPVPLAAN